jgi:predicted small integral membrane protein
LSASHFMLAWVALTGALAMIALILTAFGLILGLMKPVDAARHVRAILGTVIVLMYIPSWMMSAWSGLSFWQRIGLVAMGIGVWQVTRPRRKARKCKEK